MTSPEANIQVSPAALGEQKIKAIVISELIRRKIIRRGSLIASELSLGRLSRRIDLAIIGDEVVGIEIKSELDNLRRLRSQLDAYLTVFDKVIVASAEAHLDKVIYAVPESVTVWGVRRDESVYTCREAIFSSPLKPRSYLAPLPANELRSIIDRNASTCISNRELAEMVSDVDADAAKNALRIALAKRYGPSSTSFWESVQNNEINAEHVGNLSRFKAKRERLKENQRAKEQYWKDWLVSSNDMLASILSQSLQSSSVS